MGSTVGVDVDIDREGWQRFEDLYRSSRDDVFAYVATMLRDPAAAEDVTELAFGRAYRRRRTFDHRRGEERARPAGFQTHHGGGFTLGRAARDAGHVLTVAAGAALIGLAPLIPVALVVGLAWLIAGLFTHRRRERALDLV